MTKEQQIKADPLNINRLPFNYDNIVFNEKVGGGYKTKDYTKFNLVNVNRDVDRTTKIYKDLSASMAKRGMIIAGIVDKYGNVGEGQHRLAICMELGIEFKFELVERVDLDL